MSPLVPRRIVDKNGKPTTVYTTNEAASGVQSGRGSKKRAFPSPKSIATTILTAVDNQRVRSNQTKNSFNKRADRDYF